MRVWRWWSFVCACSGTSTTTFPLPIDLEEPGLVAGLGDEDVSVGQRLHGVDLGLRALELEDDFAVAGDLDGGAAGIGRVLIVPAGRCRCRAPSRRAWIADSARSPCRRRR